jgi:hypothetical protein
MNTRNIYEEIYNYEPLVVQRSIPYYQPRVQTTPNLIHTIEHQHRKIGLIEVVFDIDTHNRVLSNSIWDKISSGLQQDGISHSCWDTSRSPHIHCYFSGFHVYPFEVRTLMKKMIIQKYSEPYFERGFVDKSKASEHVMIRDFNAVHELTGRRKICIYNYGDWIVNDVPKSIVERIHQVLGSQPASTLRDLPITDEFKRRLADFVDYCLASRFDTNGGRDLYLFKNFVIACLKLQMPDQQRTESYKRLSQNCQGYSLSGSSVLRGWERWALKRDRLYFSWKEVDSFLKIDLKP